ncbi:hypothetical protein V2J09_006216 [Rumex salicifolius]
MSLERGERNGWERKRVLRERRGGGDRIAREGDVDWEAPAIDRDVRKDLDLLWFLPIRVFKHLKIAIDYVEAEHSEQCERDQRVLTDLSTNKGPAKRIELGCRMGQSRRNPRGKGLRYSAGDLAAPTDETLEAGLLHSPIDHHQPLEEVATQQS